MKQERADLVTRTADYVLQVRNHPLRVGGNPASPTNRTIWLRCLESWLFLIEDLMLRFGLTLQQRQSRSANFVRALIAAPDVNQVISLLDDVYLSFVTDSHTDYSSFKHYCNQATSNGSWHSELFSPINQAITGYFNTSGRERAHFLASIAQFCRFPKKLTFVDIGLEDKALEEYVQTERDLASVSFNQDDPILDGIESVIGEWFKDFSIENLLPQHGVGSVAEGPLTLAEKFDVMTVDKKVKVLLSGHYDSGSRYLEFFPSRPGDGLVRQSRTIFVPKTASKLRTISMEPATLQYLQQGVMWEVYGFIKNHPFLGVRVNLEDQGQNQILAQEGSVYHHYGTIDLSRASDSVSWALVRRVFRSSPKLLKWLIGTRSVMTLLPNGEVMQLNKYAPMGSALCFPIECIIFAAITEYASTIVCTRLKIPKRVYSVYGDDLVVQTECYDEVVKTLHHCGFSVNMEKSYNTGYYRESCGKEYYSGVDISPLYYRIPFYRGRLSPSAYGSLCSGANNALLHNLPLYRLHLITQIKMFAGGKGPYFCETPEEAPKLYSSQPTNFHLRSRWSKRYQRKEVRVLSVSSRQRSGELTDDTLAYFCRLVAMARRPLVERASSDELPLPYAMHGCIEFFNSVLLPLVPYLSRNRQLAMQWWEP